MGKVNVKLYDELKMLIYLRGAEIGCLNLFKYCNKSKNDFQFAVFELYNTYVVF
jgi:hypothetical protein